MLAKFKHILIVGAGEFGLSTALSLLRHPEHKESHITILDGASVLPNPSGSSVDASRIVRADYSHRSYAKLASEAETLWRDQTDEGWGGQGRYSETGFVLTASRAEDHYIREALINVRSLPSQDHTKIEELPDTDAIRRATGYEGVSGDYGYANWNSGWAHAEKTVAFVLRRVQEEGAGRVTIRSDAPVEKLLLTENSCRGVIVRGKEILADLVVLAAGAWTPSLLDLQGRCLATGQVLGYIDITAEEQASFQQRPVIMNMSDGGFIIPPENCQLKVARHAFGYVNPTLKDGKSVSIPKTGICVPKEGQVFLRNVLRQVAPSLVERPFVNTRICWYCDTPDGNFLIDYHPNYDNLLVATGGSGHGFKFFPVIGDKIVARIDDSLEPEFQELWRWPEARPNFSYCNDGSRTGKHDLILEEEEVKM